MILRYNIDKNFIIIMIKINDDVIDFYAKYRNK